MIPFFLSLFLLFFVAVLFSLVFLPSSEGVKEALRNGLGIDQAGLASWIMMVAAMD